MSKERQEILDLEEEPKAETHRPMLLKVLCILTWAGSAAIVIYCCFRLAGSWEYYLDLGRQMVHILLTLVSCIATGWAALMMWRLKKKGFWIYSVAELLPVITGVIALLDADVLASAAGSGTFGGGIIIRIAFVAMYYRYYRIFR